MLDPVRVLRLYMAMKLHFTSKKYDIFENRGSVNLPPNALNTNNARKGMIMRVANKMKTYPTVAEYFMSQHLYQNGTVFDPMCADENYERWEKFKMSSTQIILDDLYDKDIEKIIMGNEPPIFRLVMSEEVHIETAIALNTIKPYVQPGKDYFVFDTIATIIEKSGRWIKFNKERVCKELEHETT